MKVFGVITQNFDKEKFDEQAKKLKRIEHESEQFMELDNARILLVTKKFDKVQSSELLITVSDFNGQQFKLTKYSGEIGINFDHFGISMIYYAQHKDELIFCSEMLPIINYIGREHLTVNEEFISDMIYYQFPILHNTIFQEIRALLPRQHIRFTKQNEMYVLFKSYRSLVAETFDENNHLDLGLLEYSFGIPIYHAKNVPNTSLMSLSGGMDSRLILDILSEYDSPIDHIINYGVEGSWERIFAKKVVDELSIQHNNFTTYELTPEIIMENYPEYLKITEGLTTHLFSHLLYVLKWFKYTDDLVIYDGFYGDITLGGDDVANKFKTGFSSNILLPFLHNIPERKEFQLDDFQRFYHINRKNTSANKLFREFGMHSLPFTQKDFYEVCMSLSPKRKANHRFYKKFLKAIGRDYLYKLPSTTLKRRTLIQRIKRYLMKYFTWIGLTTKHIPYTDPNKWIRESEEYYQFLVDVLLSKRTEDRGYFNLSKITEALVSTRFDNGNSGRAIVRLFDLEMMFRILIDGDEF